MESPKGLPADVVVMNPYKDANALELSSTFYQKYYNDANERFALFGINPGRFGGGITGIPFTDPIRLEESCAIPNHFNKRSELSSKFIYDVIDAYGGPKSFYGKFYFSAISPLGYVRGGKNLNYYDIENWKELFEEYAVERIKEQLLLPIDQSVAFCIGQGQNLKFLEYLNGKYQFFHTIKTVPHPRWVMQYRLKRKEEFIEQYIQALDAC